MLDLIFLSVWHTCNIVHESEPKKSAVRFSIINDNQRREPVLETMPRLGFQTRSDEETQNTDNGFG